MELLRQERLKQMAKRHDKDIFALLREREMILRYLKWLEQRKKE